MAAGVVAVGGERLLADGRRRTRRPDRTALLRDLPGACDLIAVCLAAGVPVAGALAAVGEAVPGPLGGQLRTGRGAATGWVPSRGGPGRTCPPSWPAWGGCWSGRGSPAPRWSPRCGSLAADSRAAPRADAEAAVRRAGVWVLAPLGACFLPAFLCLGVVPLILGIAGDVFG